jgi:hypothetical protein
MKVCGNCAIEVTEDRFAEHARICSVGSHSQVLGTNDCNILNSVGSLGGADALSSGGPVVGLLAPRKESRQQSCFSW